VSAPLAEAEVAVIGGGVMAGALAHELAVAGRRPVLVPDPLQTEIGHAASGPFVPYREAVRRLGHEGALEVWRAFRESHDRLRAFLTGASRDCGYRQRGAFLLAEDRAQGLSLADSEDLLRDDGFAGEFLDHYMLEARFDVSGFKGAYWAADDAELDAALLGATLREAAALRGAVVAEAFLVRAIEVGAPGVVVTGDRGSVRAERAVLAADGLVRRSGLSLVLQPRAGVEAEVAAGATLPGRARSADGRFGWHAGDGVVRLEAAGSAADVDRLLGHVQARARARWSSESLASPDGLPRIGPLGEGRLLLACGPEPVGLAFAAARWVAETLRTGRDPTPKPLSAARV